MERTAPVPTLVREVGPESERVWKLERVRRTSGFPFKLKCEGAMDGDSSDQTMCWCVVRC